MQGLQVLRKRWMQQLQPIRLVHTREMEGRVLERSFPSDGLRDEGVQGF